MKRITMERLHNPHFNILLNGRVIGSVMQLGEEWLAFDQQGLLLKDHYGRSDFRSRVKAVDFLISQEGSDDE